MTKARDLANIITGGFTSSDIPNLAASKITSGTFADARLPATALNSNVDLTTLNASHLTSGTVASARLGSGTASSSTFLRGDQTYAEAGGGKINQIVQTHNTTLSQMSSSSFADVSGMSVAITPSASNSKIFIIVSLYSGQNGNSVGFFKLLRGSTVIGSGADAGNRVGCTFSYGVDGGDGHSQVHSNSYNYLDSPNTTSETTYKIQGASYNNGTLTFNKTPNDADHVTSARCTSVITAMEVLA